MASSNPPRDRAKEDRDFVESVFLDACANPDPVHIYVHGEEEPYLVRKYILAAASPEFEAYCNAHNGIVRLQEGKGALQVLVGWATRRVVLDADQLALAEAYISCQKFNIRDLRMAILQKLQQMFLQPGDLDPKAVAAVYRQAHAASIQKIFVQQVAKDITQPRNGTVGRYGWDLEDLQSGLGQDAASMQLLLAAMAPRLSRAVWPQDEPIARKRRRLEKMPSRLERMPSRQERESPHPEDLNSESEDYDSDYYRKRAMQEYAIAPSNEYPYSREHSVPEESPEYEDRSILA
ncbi:hypothetical protein LTR95_004442 [Oleoguttula sp. CCFEE 5521]